MVRAYSSHRQARLGALSPARARSRSSISAGTATPSTGQGDPFPADPSPDAMTELERLTAFYEAEAEGREPAEVARSQMAREAERQLGLQQQLRDHVSTTTAGAGGRPHISNRTAAAGGPAPPASPAAPLMSRRPQVAKVRRRPAPPGGSGARLFAGALLLGAGSALWSLRAQLGQLLVWAAALAGGLFGVLLVRRSAGSGPGSGPGPGPGPGPGRAPRARRRSEEELAVASRTLQTQQRGAHDAVASRTFRLRGAKVQVLDVRVMEGSYASYRITVHCRGQFWDVWHRFAEFDTLRSALEAGGALPPGTPPLPGKTLRHRFDQSFLLQRKDKLRAFVGSLMESDAVCDRDDVRRFLLMPPLPGGAPPAERRASWLGRLIGSGSKEEEAEEASPGRLRAGAGAGAGLGGPGDGDLVDAATGEVATVRMWQSPFKRSTLREVLDEFSDAGPVNGFVVRGLNYCNRSHPDYRKKVKAGPAMFELLHVDLFAVDEDRYPEGRHFHVAARGLAAERVAYFRTLPSRPFLFIMNLQVPGDPPISVVCYWAIAQSLLDGVDPADASPEAKFYRAFRAFADFENTHGGPEAAAARGEPEPEGAGVLPRGDLRNERFKMIPCLQEAPWVVKSAVPIKPAIMGKKLVVRWFRGPHHMEVDLDVASERIGSSVVGLCRGYTRNMVVDVGVCVQGEREEELPERMIGVVRMHNLDLDFAQDLEG